MKTWLTIQTLLFELASLYLLQNAELSALQWLSYITSHAMAAGTFTLVCWLVLPNRLKLPLIPAMLFIATIAFCIPVLGMIGLATIFIVALYFPKKDEKILWKHTHNLELPIHPEQIESNQYGYGALKDILLFNPSDEKRLMATNSCRFLPPQAAIPLLKHALTDRNDDIRLLAYAAIEKIEFNLNTKISGLQKRLEKRKSAVLFQRIAEHYWELCYLGIAEGPIRDYYLQQAQSYLEQALALNPDPSIELKLGRILLEQNNFTLAEQHLAQARQKGIIDLQVAPYMAEIMFSKERYQDVQTLLQKLPDSTNPLISELKEYWSRAAS